jgi:hypothetical protein
LEDSTSASLNKSHFSLSSTTSLRGLGSKKVLSLRKVHLRGTVNILKAGGNSPVWGLKGIGMGPEAQINQPSPDFKVHAVSALAGVVLPIPNVGMLGGELEHVVTNHTEFYHSEELNMQPSPLVLEKCPEYMPPPLNRFVGIPSANVIKPMF